MSQVIRIPQPLYSRLAAYAEGFDTPANVIERVLDFYEQHEGHTKSIHRTSGESGGIEIEPAYQLEIVYVPSDLQAFKAELLQTKKATVELYKTDGSKDTRVWNAEKMTQDSDINSNLRSGYLRGWREKGIEKAVIKILNR